MDRINISSDSPFEKKIGFSRAVKANGVIYVSGTAPVDGDGSTQHVGDAYGQTQSCLFKIRTAIEDAGGTWENIVRTRIYLKNVADWEEAARAHKEMLGNIGPACTFLEVKGFINPEWLVEMEAECIY